MTDGVRIVGATELNACCVQLYSNDWVKILVGESLHPGGLELTQHLGQVLGLGPGRTLLDVALAREPLRSGLRASSVAR